MRPGIVAPLKLVDMIIGAPVGHMLSEFGVEGIAGRIVGRERRSGRQSQVVMMPADGIFPKFVDMTIRPKIDHMLRRLTVEHVRIWRSSRQRGARCHRKVAMVPTVVPVPSELVDVEIASLIENILAAVEFLTDGDVDRQRRIRGCVRSRWFQPSPLFHSS